MPPGEGVQPLSLLLGRGLLTISGEVHRTRRRLVAPLFHSQRVTEYAETFARLADERASGWADGERLDVHDEMGKLTLSIIARTVFDADLDSDVMTTIRRAVAATSSLSLLAPFPRAMAVAARLGLRATRRAQQAREDLYAAMNQMMDDRRHAGAGGGDLLSLLLATRDADTGDALDDEAVRDEALTIMLAGHETTANALSWAYHLLGDHPRVAAAMHTELDTVLGGRLPSAEDLRQLPYTRAVFAESLRLYPPAWMIIRHSLRDSTLGGVHIPADSTIVMSPWVVHRDPQIWPEPDQFRPERWLGRQAENQPGTPPGNQPADAAPAPRATWAADAATRDGDGKDAQGATPGITPPHGTAAFPLATWAAARPRGDASDQRHGPGPPRSKIGQEPRRGLEGEASEDTDRVTSPRSPAGTFPLATQVAEGGPRHRFSYFPFGGGTRQCVGNTFAEMEGVMILATLGRTWTFDAIPGTRVQPHPRVVLRPKNGLPMTARRR